MTLTYDARFRTISIALTVSEAGYLTRLVKDEGATSIQDRLQSWLNSITGRYIQIDQQQAKEAVEQLTPDQLTTFLTTLSLVSVSPTPVSLDTGSNLP